MVCQSWSKDSPVIVISNLITISKVTMSLEQSLHNWTAWSTKMLTACCQPVLEEHNWHCLFDSCTLVSWVSSMYLTHLCSKQLKYLTKDTIFCANLFNAHFTYQYQILLQDKTNTVDKSDTWIERKLSVPL